MGWGNRRADPSIQAGAGGAVIRGIFWVYPCVHSRGCRLQALWRRSGSCGAVPSGFGRWPQFNLRTGGTARQARGSTADDALVGGRAAAQCPGQCWAGADDLAASYRSGTRCCSTVAASRRTETHCRVIATSVRRGLHRSMGNVIAERCCWVAHCSRAAARSPPSGRRSIAAMHAVHARRGPWRRQRHLGIMPRYSLRTRRHHEIALQTSRPDRLCCSGRGRGNRLRRAHCGYRTRASVDVDCADSTVDAAGSG